MKETPLMKQYRTIKEESPGTLLLFRMGDFYELFDEDARTAAATLGLTLTTRTSGGESVPMAGFPYHALHGYLAKLVQQGHRVAVCERETQHPASAR